MRVNVPPIKSQGIKTKLVPWIKSIIPEDQKGLWIEPFMGTGVVGFNIAQQQALLCDTNPHLINFYNAIANNEITSIEVKQFLTQEGNKLLEQGESYYYEIRNRFNQNHNPLDFLFINRAGFNGMIRFNRKAEFNVPFCRKPQRFAPAYISKIVNQVSCISNLLKLKRFTFKCQTFLETIREGKKEDIIYCDPPYIDRHADYYNGWGEEQEKELFSALSKTQSKFILSTWHHNDYRANEYVQTLWKNFNILTCEHFYHVGGSEKNRNPMTEALITNYEITDSKYPQTPQTEQLLLFA